MLDINKILVPIDLSSRSGPAVEHAANIAQHFGAELIFLHVVHPFTYNAALASGYPGGLIPSDASDEQLAEILAEFLENKIPGVGGEQILRRGDAAHVIENVAEEYDADLIVMPTAGAGVFRRFLIGSVTAKVLHDSDCPVLTGAHVEPIKPFAAQPYQQVGCAIQLEDGDSDLLQKTIDLAAPYDAQVVVLHAIDRFKKMPESDAGKKLRETAVKEAEELSGRAGLSTKPVVRFGAAKDVISDAAKELDLDVVVAARQQEDEPSIDMYGLVRNSPCPVLRI